MTKNEVRELIRKELPDLFYKDEEIHRFIMQLSSHHFADKVETESKFDSLLKEIHDLRDEGNRQWKEQNKKWEEQNKKWEEQNRKWEENNKRLKELNERLIEQDKKWEEQNRKWDEQNRKWDEYNKKWEEHNKKWEEQNRKWDKNQEHLSKMMEEIKSLHREHKSTIGALGARWGLYTEQSFRNALKGILEDSFDVKVMNVTEYDEEGVVFGQPDQIELDIIIKDGVLILCEIKSSMSKSDVYAFNRKVKFYEKLHDRKVNESIIISPMVSDNAREIADQYGIKVYSSAIDVDLKEL